jgi:hypothetical protein
VLFYFAVLYSLGTRRCYGNLLMYESTRLTYTYCVYYGAVVTGAVADLGASLVAYLLLT